MQSAQPYIYWLEKQIWLQSWNSIDHWMPIEWLLWIVWLGAESPRSQVLPAWIFLPCGDVWVNPMQTLFGPQWVLKILPLCPSAMHCIQWCHSWPEAVLPVRFDLWENTEHTLVLIFPCLCTYKLWHHHAQHHDPENEATATPASGHTHKCSQRCY